MTWMWTLIVLSLCFFFDACVAASLDICPLNSNDTVTTSSNITWAQAVDQPIRQLDGPSYLRPDIGTYFCRLQHPAAELYSINGADGSLIRRRIGSVGLQHHHPAGPHTGRDHPRRQMGSRADMVLGRHRFHHCDHSSSFRIHEFPLG